MHRNSPDSMQRLPEDELTSFVSRPEDHEVVVYVADPGERHADLLSQLQLDKDNLPDEVGFGHMMRKTTPTRKVVFVDPKSTLLGYKSGHLDRDFSAIQATGKAAGLEVRKQP